jgi:peptidoglycan hydrolase CwlO-like protein
MRLTAIDKSNKSSSYPPTNPFGNLAMIVEPIISIMNRIEAILAKTLTSNARRYFPIKIPEIQKRYAKMQDELEAIDYKKTMAKYQLDDMNNQITYLNRISYSKRNEIAYLKIGVQELEGYVHGLNNHNQQQQIQNE